MLVRLNFNGPHVWHSGEQSHRMFKKAIQQGRRE